MVSLGASLASATVIQKGNLRITLLAQIKPLKLPRTGTAPVAVFMAGHIATPTGAVPPQLQKLTFKINRHGLLQSQHLPTCTLPRVETVTSRQALSLCGDALIGSGRFWATVAFAGQRPFPTRGRLLVFNGRRAGKPILLAQIYTNQPASASFVIAFRLRRIDEGPYGTELSASLPAALGDWGFVDRIKLTLRRQYTYRGRHRSYFNAGCPALRGSTVAVFPLALATFSFAGGKQLSLSVTKSCRVGG